jgi:hypothetical protein
LILEEQIMHLPKVVLCAGGLRGLCRFLRVRMNAAQRIVLIDDAKPRTQASLEIPNHLE